MADRSASRQPSQPPWLLGRALASLEQLNERLRGELRRSLAAGAAGSAGVATLLELLPEGRVPSWPPLSIASGCLGLLALIWMGSCRDSRGALRGDQVWAHLRAELELLARGLSAWPRSPKLSRLLIASRTCAALGLSALALSTSWDVLRRLAHAASSPRLIGLQLFGCAALGLSQLAVWARRAQSQRDASQPEQCRLAAREYPALVDLAQPLELDSVFLEPSVLHEIIAALGSWEAPRSCPSGAAYTRALQLHLQSWLPFSAVEHELWLGATSAAGIADLIVEGAVLIEVQRGFSSRRAEGALARVRACIENAPGKPVVLVIFDTVEVEDVLSGAGDSLRSLHASGAFLAVRMPAARTSYTAVRDRSLRPSSIPPSLA